MRIPFIISPGRPHRAEHFVPEKIKWCKPTQKLMNKKFNFIFARFVKLFYSFWQWVFAVTTYSFTFSFSFNCLAFIRVFLFLFFFFNCRSWFRSQIVIVDYTYSGFQHNGTAHVLRVGCEFRFIISHISIVLNYYYDCRRCRHLLLWCCERFHHYSSFNGFVRSSYCWSTETKR